MNPALPTPFAAIAALLLATLAAVSAVRLSGMSIHAPDAAPIATRELRFQDQADGSIAVMDATRRQRIALIEGQAGFVRGTLRGLARERRREGIGADRPFELVARADGRLTLIDPATGRRVDLESFGPTNAGEFARLLAPAAR
jgi:putative photosynthetic complex assembly protein